MDLFMSFIFSYCPPILFFFSSWMGVSVRMVLTTARASITPCLFVFTHTFFVLFLFPFLFFFVLICMLGGIFNEKEPGFGLVLVPLPPVFPLALLSDVVPVSDLDLKNAELNVVSANS